MKQLKVTEKTHVMLMTMKATHQKKTAEEVIIMLAEEKTPATITKEADHTKCEERYEAQRLYIVELLQKIKDLEEQ